MSKAYLDRGVSPTKDDVHSAIEKVDAGVFPGAFCKLVPDLAGDPDYAAVLHADGAGTKSLVAYLDYKEHGRPDAFEGIAQDSTVMNVDDLLCVGVTDSFLLSNTIGRNAHRIDAGVLKAIIGGYERFAERMRPFGIEIVTAGGETADVGDLVQTVIVDSTVYARIRRSDVIDCSNITPGDVIVGFASYGRASYEDAENSGMGSNGLTAARHVMLHPEYAQRYPETFSNTIEPSHVYGGPYRLDDPLPDSGLTVGQALVSPTRTYAPIVRAVLAAHRDSLHGLIHCTGGGQAKCLSFGRDLRYIKREPLPVPPLFRAIAETGSVDTKEMFQVFNMGSRMEVYCTADAADAIVEIARGFDIDAQIIGEVLASKKPGKNELFITHDAAEISFER